MDDMDHKILWVVKDAGMKPVTVDGVQNTLQTLSKKQIRVTRSTLVYRMNRLVERHNVLQAVAHPKNKRWKLYKPAPAGSEVFERLPLSFAALLNKYESDAARPRRLKADVELSNRDVELVPASSVASFYPPIKVPKALPDYDNILGRLDMLSMLRKDRVCAVRILEILYLAYTIHPYVGFRTWMMHKWLQCIHTFTRYFDLSGPELSERQLSKQTRLNYKSLLREETVIPVVSGEVEETIRRNRIREQFRLWYKVPYRRGFEPHHLLSAFIKTVFPDLFQAIHVPSESVKTYDLERGSIPKSSFAWVNVKIPELLLAVDIMPLYAVLKLYTQAADFNYLVYEVIRKGTKQYHAGRGLLASLHKFIRKTAAPTVLGVWDNYREHMEPEAVPSRLVQGVPTPGSAVVN